MNFSNCFKSLTAGLLTTVSALSLAALLPTSAHAVTITSTTSLPTMYNTNTAFYFGGSASNPSLDDPTQYDFGVFTFQNPSSVPSLVGLSITMTISGLNTTAGNDFGNIDLTLNGIDTGLAINNFGPTTSTGTVTGLFNLTSDQATLLYNEFEGGGYTYSPLTLAAGDLTHQVQTTTGQHGIGAGDQTVDSGGSYNNYVVTTNPDNSTTFSGDSFDTPSYSAATTTAAGQLVVGLAYVGTQYPDSPALNSQYNSDQFQLYGGTASLSVANTPIAQVPFSPSQTAGFGLIALFIALWYVPQTNAMMKRLLVPAAV